MSSMLNPAADNLSQFTATGGEPAFRQNEIESGGFRQQTQPYTPAETPGWLRSFQEALTPAPDSVTAGLGVGAPGTTNQNETPAARDARMNNVQGLFGKVADSVVPGLAFGETLNRMATSDEDPTARDYVDATVSGLGLVNPLAGAVGKLGLAGYDMGKDAYAGYNMGPVSENSTNASKLGNWAASFSDPLGAFAAQQIGRDNEKMGPPTPANLSPYASEFMRNVEAAQANNTAQVAQTAADSAAAAQSVGQNYGGDAYSMGPPSPGGRGTDGMGAGYGNTGTNDSMGRATGMTGTSFADGGVVGLSTPGYADGGFMSSPPSNLTQMGFANGGSIGLGAPGSTNSPDGMQAQVARMARDPQLRQRLQQMMAPAMQSGQLTPDELVTIGRIATAAMHNPDLYPQLRQFVAQQGLNPLPAAYSPQVVMTLLVASQIMGPTPAGQVPPTDQAQMQNPTGAANGGMLQGPGTGRSDSIGTVNESTGAPVKVANGEYVIPEHVVKAKGRDFFDKMLRQYAQLTPSEK
jgi:hypothetical protein